MSLQPQKTKSGKFWLKASSIAGLILACGSSASAIPVSNNLQQFINVVSQNNSQPPDIIIDPNPNGGGRTSDRTNPRRTTRNTDTRFTCDYVNGEYTVMYHPEDQANSSYPWAIPSQMGGGWTPERRCNAIADRLENYRADGLIEMSTGLENGYNTVCVTTQIDPTDCRIVLTVPPNQDPQITRDLVFENLLIADGGDQTQGVYTFGESGNSNDILGDIGNVLGVNKPASSPDKIDLRPFLSPSDGGTGERLKGNSITPQRPSGSNNSDRKPAIFR